MKRYIIIVAGGKGLRMESDLPKQFIPLHGRPVLMHTLDCFHHWNDSAEIILVLPEEHQAYWNRICKELNYLIPHQIVNGGETRFHSVKNGLSPIKDGYVAIHDGVRPFVSNEVINACFQMAERKGAAIPVIPIVESIREIRSDGKSKPVDRNNYVIVQTPQVFRSEWLLSAYQLPYNDHFTDDASVIEAKGYEIHTVTGNSENMKITTPADLLIAETMLLKGKLNDRS